MALDITRAWFSYEDHAGQPRCVVTTSDMDLDDASTSPVAYIVDKLTYRQWQSPSETDWFQIDFGDDVSIQCLTVVFARITSPYRRYDTQEILPTDTVRHKLDADGGTPGTGAVFDSGVIDSDIDTKRGYHVCALATPVTARYWRCLIDAPSRAGEGFFLVMFVQAGPIFQPAFNHVYGERISYPDNAALQRAPSSQAVFVTRNERTLESQLIWDFIQQSERDDWRGMFEYAGSSEPVTFSIASPDADPFTSVAGPNGWVIEGDKAFVGVFDADLSISSRQFNASIVQIQMTEHR